MKKIPVIGLIALFTVAAAYGETPTKRSIGWDGDVQGISFRAITASGLGFGAAAGIMFDSPKNERAETKTDVYLGLTVFKSVWEHERGNLNGFGSAMLDVFGNYDKDDDSQIDFTFAAGLEPEIFLIKNLSVTTRFGIALKLIGDDIDNSDDGTTIISTFGNKISVVEGFSFNWYF
ncbi:hypothetical protein LLG96_03775 [bacterium]|nr:hypothetical protein [bacterium]